MNFLATYGRSLFSLACGLFSGRWLLMALGEVDYGLYGVVGGLTAFISFTNNLMGGAVSRYYAFHVGAAKESGAAGLEECRKWFTTAVVIHTFVPIVLMLIGYPLGIWAVQRFLAIPPDRISDCLKVWQCACVTCFVGMVNVPFVAMYVAKQEIAEMTIYGVFQTTVNVVMLYFMVSHEGQWLVGYAFGSCLIMIVPQLVMCVRAAYLFPECRFRLSYAFERGRIKELMTFASLRFAGALALMVQGQGLAILTNKLLGPTRNAAMSIGNTLANHTRTLAGALNTALEPAITNACGAGDYKRMHMLCYQCCKFGTFFMLIFAVPLALEAPEVLVVWLKNPPDYAAILCVCILFCLVLENMTAGLFMAIFAVGKIGWYQLFMGVCGLLAVALAGVLMSAGMDLFAVGLALVLSKCVVVFVRLWFGKRIGGISVRHWLMKIAAPLIAAAVVSGLAGLGIVSLLNASFVRIVVTTGVVELVFLPLCWFAVLTVEERQLLTKRFRKYVPFA